GNISGFSNGVGSSINQQLTNLITTAGVVNYKISFTTALCAGSDSIFPVTVNPKPHLSNAPAAKQICSGVNTNITLTSDVIGTLFTWTATGSTPQVSGFSNNSVPTTTLNQILVNSGYNIETVTYHCTAHANGCDGPVTDYVVTVYPVPDLSNSPATGSICNNQYTNLNLTSHITGTLFTWSCTPSSGNVSGYSNNSTPTNYLNQLIFNSGGATESLIYHLTPSANGCFGPVQDFFFTLNPQPHVITSPMYKTICSQTAPSVNLLSSCPGTIFTWTPQLISGSATGFSPGVGPLINQTITNTGNIPAVINYIVSMNTGICLGNDTTYTITVSPKPLLTNTPLFSQLCNNTSTNLTLTSNVTGTLFTWTCTPSSANITGWSDNTGSPTVILNQTLFNSGLSVENVVYHLTPHANGCDGPLTNFTVSVVQSPDVYFSPAAKTICSAQSFTIQVLSHVPGTVFTWTATSSSPDLSGFSNGSGNSISQPVVNSGTTIETVTYTAFPSVAGCTPGTPQSVVLTVNPKPAVTNTTTSFQQCSAVMTNIPLTSGVSGATFAWSASGSSLQVTGYASSAGLTIQQTLEEALSMMLRSPVQLTGAGRTDTGVHADEFFAHFDFNNHLAQIDRENLVFRLNAYLGGEIVLFKIFPVKEDTHARFSAISRTYRYRIVREKNPFRRNFTHYI
ncbi:MAG: PKD-like domain-containing protein, partial [Bacteroidota bacterium]